MWLGCFMTKASDPGSRECDRDGAARLDRTFEQHRQLLFVVDRLRVIAWAPPGGIPAPRLGALLLHELEQFRSELGAHFAFEEKGGYMSDIAAAHPELSLKISGLEGQHGLMLSRLDTLIELAATPDTCAVKDGLISLFERFESHERAEREILLESSCRDLGDSG